MRYIYMITYPLSERVTAFTTTRRIGRDPELLCAELGVDAGRFARPHQVHGVRIMPIAEEFFALGEDTRKRILEGVDAVIYNVRETCIGISTADCIPVLVYDPEHHCAAAIHAGWRGTVARIVIKTMEMMTQMYGTDATRVKCAIGPGIALDSFEVGDEVYSAFAEAGFPMDSFARRYQVKGQEPLTKWHLDIKECNRMQLLSLGVAAENVIVSDIDTMTDERFFSARREGAKTGRILSGIVLR